MHTSATKGIAAVLISIAIGATVAAQAPQRAAARSRERGSPVRYQEYRVAAGTFVAIELRTALSSNSNGKGDPVDGRLLLPLTVDGVELVPAGATVLGSVSEVEPAGKKQRGRLAFAFHIIEHPETGSRATIRGTVLTFASETPKKGNVFPEVRLDKGLDASISLLAPLNVRIPVQR